MGAIRPCELPSSALLRKYQQGGAWADCYSTEIARHVSHSDYVEAFYTTPLFKVERRLLSWFVAKPSTDAEARQLAAGELDSFAAWNVEARNEGQLLMADFQGRTRSWLMVAAANGGPGESTCLYFGSAIIPEVNARTGAQTTGLAFRSLLGFHNLYSRALLSAAKARIEHQS